MMESICIDPHHPDGSGDPGPIPGHPRGPRRPRTLAQRPGVVGQGSYRLGISVPQHSMYIDPNTRFFLKVTLFDLRQDKGIQFGH